MPLSAWLAFAAAALVMGLIPGPGVTSIVGYALSSGRRTALASVAGIALGNVVCMSVSLAGAGAVLAASAMAFLVLKWAGALYLIGLGVLAIARSRQGLADAATARADHAAHRVPQQRGAGRLPSEDHRLLRRLRAAVHLPARALCPAGRDPGGHLRGRRGHHRHRLRAGGVARLAPVAQPAGDAVVAPRRRRGADRRGPGDRGGLAD